MSTLSGDTLSVLHDQAVRALGPEVLDVLGTQNLVDTVVRALASSKALDVQNLIDQVDWDAVLSSPEVQQMMDEAPRVLVPPSREVQQMMDAAVGTHLGGAEQLTSPEDSATPIEANPPNVAEQVRSLSPAEVVAAQTLLYTKVAAVVAILSLIVSVVVAVHGWLAPKTASPVTNQTTTNVTNSETTVNVTNSPAAPPPCAPKEQGWRP